MKKIITYILLIALLFTTPISKAASQYIIKDSNTRYLTWDELMEWDYESIGFLFNEIFARHGYNFRPGEKYDLYFNTRPWYTPNDNPNNTEACYPYLNEVEWYNEKLCKDLMAEMRNSKWYNPGGKNFRDYVEWGFDVLLGFDFIELRADQRLDIYSAPTTNSYRGANGKAKLSTNGAVYIAGIEQGWYFAMYETNNGSVRVGYFESSKLKDNIFVPNLQFAYEDATVNRYTFITDDPAKTNSTILYLNEGTSVTYLNTYMNSSTWAYIETTMPEGKLVRGFVPANDITVEYFEDNGDI